MCNVHDVAAALMERTGPMSTMKLQKLTFYCQAWHLAWYGESLFPEPVEAWVNGPIIRALWKRHKGRRLLTKWDGSCSALSQRQAATADRVLMFYGALSATDLSTLTHSEKPWRDARYGLDHDEIGTTEITPAAMRTHYAVAASLVNSSDPFQMVNNLVRQLPDGTWGVNIRHSQPLYIGYAMKLLAPFISQQLKGPSPIYDPRR